MLQAGQADSNTSTPSELTQLMQSLQQLRPPSAGAEVEKQSSANHNGAIADRHEPDTEQVQVEVGVREKKDFMTELETRLKLYIDEKFEQLEKKLERHITELLNDRLQSDRQCT